jgi:hypothetical protein
MPPLPALPMLFGSQSQSQDEGDVLTRFHPAHAVFFPSSQFSQGESVFGRCGGASQPLVPSSEDLPDAAELFLGSQGIASSQQAC